MAKANPNRRIEALLSGNLHIDAWDALDAYSRYMRELEYLSAGGSYAELGFAERRQSQGPIVIADGKPWAKTVSEVGVKSHVDAAGNIYAMTSGGATVAMLNLTGVMRTDGGPSSYGVAKLADDIVSWSGVKELTGIIIRGRSGGGESMSADVLDNAILTAKESMPVVTYGDRLGSAAVNGTRNSSEIIASSYRARFGSIGSYISLDRKLLKQYSKQILDVYSDLSPDKNAEWRALFQGDMEPLKAMVRTDASEFQEAMRVARPLRGSAATINETLSGGMFSAADAKARGLIDGVGTLSYAIRRVLVLSQAA